MNAHIYHVFNPANGKQYVGQTTVASNKHGHGNLIRAAYKKHGHENFEYMIICGKVAARNTLNYLERFWIKVFNTRAPNGYNIEEGGSDRGEMAESTKQKLREANLGKVIPEGVRSKISNALKGNKNPFYGKTHSQEVIAKIVAANVGKTVVISEAQKLKLREMRLGDKNPMYGKPITEEHRAKLKANSAKNKPWLGKKFTDAQKAHLTKEYVCPHCGKIGKGNAMIRHHLDNCKEAA